MTSGKALRQKHACVFQKQQGWQCVPGHLGERQGRRSKGHGRGFWVAPFVKHLLALGLCHDLAVPGMEPELDSAGSKEPARDSPSPPPLPLPSSCARVCSRAHAWALSLSFSKERNKFKRKKATGKTFGSVDHCRDFWLLLSTKQEAMTSLEPRDSIIKYCCIPDEK